MRTNALKPLLAAALVCAAASAPAQERDFSKIEIKTADLGHGLYMLTGEGGNITVAMAKDGLVMVDTEFAPLSEKIEAAVAKLSTAPLRYVIDTHMHGDHVGGNANFARAGAVLVAHENARKSLADGSVKLDGTKVPPAPADMLPAITYATALTLHLDGQTAELRHPAPAHTDGDTYVYFPEADVLATGDLFTADRYPFIDTGNGGGIDGTIAAVDTLLALAKDSTKIAPGHGPLATRAMLVSFRAALADWRGRVAALKAQGKSEDDAVAAKPLASYDTAYARSADLPDRTVRLIYRSLR